MTPSRECPKCGADISDSYQEYDPSVGMMNAGWYCEACEVFVEHEDDVDDYYS
jgi:DNA-directed RNA polymerase subunit N (RpoN/RPB10)